MKTLLFLCVLLSGCATTATVANRHVTAAIVANERAGIYAEQVGSVSRSIGKSIVKLRSVSRSIGADAKDALRILDGR